MVKIMIFKVMTTKLENYFKVLQLNSGINPAVIKITNKTSLVLVKTIMAIKNLLNLERN